MKLNQAVFAHNLKRHKKFLGKIVKTADKGKIHVLSKQAEELSLAYSGCKCQGCESTENLTWHHLIMRPIKKFVDFWRYISMRYYWNNIIILCSKCHKEVHGLYLVEEDEMGTISQEKIDKILAKYYKEDEDDAERPTGEEVYGFDEKDRLVPVNNP